MKQILPNKDPAYKTCTELCPLCFGRGRVPKDGYGFTEDVYKAIYEEEQAVMEAENIIKEGR